MKTKEVIANFRSFVWKNNSLCGHLKKCTGKSMKNMDYDVRVYRVKKPIAH